MQDKAISEYFMNRNIKLTQELSHIVNKNKHI